MNRAQMKHILQTGHRATLPVARKAILRERLVDRIQEETSSVANGAAASPVSVPFTKRNLGRVSYLYPAAGIVAAAGIAGVVAAMFGIGGTPSSSASSASRASSSQLSTSSTSSNAAGSTSSTSENTSSTNENTSTSVVQSQQKTTNSRVPSTASEMPKASVSSSGSSSSSASSSAPALTSTSSSKNGKHAVPRENGTTMNGTSTSSGAVHSSAALGLTGASNGAMQHTPSQMAKGIQFTDVRMLSEATGWAMGSDGMIWYTSHAGATWHNVTPAGMSVMTKGATSSAHRLGAVDFATKQIASFAIASSSSQDRATIYVTSNAGKTWNSAQISLPAGGEIAQMQMVNAKIGFAVVTAHPTITNLSNQTFALYRTEDGGKSWTMIETDQHGIAVSNEGPNATKTLVHFASPTNGWRMANVDGQQVIEVTNDGGRTWETWTVSLPVPTAMQQLAPTTRYLPVFTGERGMFAVTYSSHNGAVWTEFYRTSNGGITWIAGQPILSHDTNVGMSGASGRLAWVVDASNGTLSLTSDGGQSWTAVKLPKTVQDASKYEFVDAQHGYATVPVGAGGTELFATTDGGQSWHPQTATVHQTS